MSCDECTSLIVAGRNFVGRTQIDVNIVDYRQLLTSADKCKKKSVTELLFKSKNRKVSPIENRQLELESKLIQLKSHRRNAICQLDDQEQMGLGMYVMHEAKMKVLQEYGIL